MPVRRLRSRIALPLAAITMVAVVLACQPLTGTPSAYTLLYPDPSHRGRYVGWQPCTTLHVRVNLKSAPSFAAQDVLVALAQVTASTGMHFAYDGTTSYLPWKYPSFAGYPGQTDLVIAWSTPSQVSGLAGDVVGIGGAALSWGAGIQTRPVKGSVVLDATTPVRPGFGYGVTDGSLVMHELGHVLGLGHSSEAVEVMFPALHAASRSNYMKGDLSGLWQLGYSLKCPYVHPRTAPIPPNAATTGVRETPVREATRLPTD